MPTPPSTAAELLDLVRRSGVVAPDRAADLSDLNLPPDAQKAAAVLVAQGVLTRFQAQQLLAGRHKGFRVGPYAVLDLLGRGGMGAVYLAEHLELRRKVAIKVLVAGKDDDQKLAAERFLREARSAAALDHPNIVRIFDVARHADTPYLVMEYVEGDTLQAVLDRDGPVPYPEAAEYVAQAAAGLQHAHERGFVHRDVKPANLIRDGSGTVKILDMGLARSSAAGDKLTEMLDRGAVVGTADFIAPEQGLNLPVDGRADIYALGATFFALVIGKPPFDGNTTQKLLQHQLKNAPTLSSLDATLPTALSTVVAKMLAKKPADRHQTPAEVIAALAPWAGNSSRILAGLSRTRLAQGADLHAALSGGGSSRRLRGPQPPDTGEVDTAGADHPGAAAAHETAAGNGSATDRALTAPAPPDPAPARRRAVWYAAAAAAVLAAGVGGWLALRPDPPGPVADNRPPPPPDDPKPVDPKPKDPVVPPKKVDPPPGDKVVYRFDPADLAAFRVTLKGGAVTDGKRGDLPRGVAIYALKPDTEAAFAAGPADGVPALTVTRVGGAPGAQVAFELEREPAAAGLGLALAANHEYLLRVRYRAAAPALLGVSVHTFAYKSAGYKVFPATGDAWGTAELPFRRGADPVRAAVEVLGGAGAPVALGPVEVVGPTKAAPAPADKVLFRLDLAGRKPFATRLALDPDPKDPGKNVVRAEPRAGDGALPAGWTARLWNPKSVVECFADDAAGSPALGLRTVSGPGSGMLFGPRVECPSGFCRVRVEYQATGRPGSFTVKAFCQGAAAWEVMKPDPTPPGEWRAAEAEVRLKGAALDRLEFHHSDPNPATVLRVRAVEVTELPDPSPRPEGATVFALDVKAIAPFEVRKQRHTRVAGAAEKLPPGVACGSWKEKDEGEFRRAEVDGTPALGVTNLTDPGSAQFYFNLEAGMKVPLRPGADYRVKVGYRTAGAGSALVQLTPAYKTLVSVPLKNTGGEWAEAVLTFTRPPAEDDVGVRLTVGNTASGEANVLWIRSLQIVELPPAKD
ncbi:MAG: hypothetical protein C0501_00215 [Isosphaera sp.]|nr:hypothetical protein [Isosphaera sp.]